MINSMASVAFIIPPNPTTGMSTAFATWLTIRKATGFTQGPLSPPVPMLKREQRRSMSMLIPIRVLMSDTLSAPCLLYTSHTMPNKGGRATNHGEGCRLPSIDKGDNSLKRI